MKFTVAGSKITCSRIDNTVDDGTQYRCVAVFDAHVDTVPPHVAAKLTAGEIKELKGFLSDRKRIQANPAERNMLEALPELLRDATEILKSVDRLNRTMYRTLANSIDDLSRALESVKPGSNSYLTPIKNMRESEALKEQLETIKKRL